MDEDFEQKSYTYHFYFHDGLFETFVHLEQFIITIDNFLSEKLQNKNEFEEGENKIHPKFDDEIQFGTIFPDLLWRTTFLHSYFLLESSLDEICNNIQKAEKFKIELKDIRGNGIQRANLYFKKVVNVTKPFETKIWKELQDFSKIRNIFVHSDGNTSLNNQELISISKKYKGLTVFESFDSMHLSISIEKEFTFNALKSIETFFQDIYNGLISKNNN